MKKGLRRSFSVIIGGTVLLSLGIVYAINTVGSGFKTTGSNVEIDAHGTCQNVRHTGGTSYFVPTKSSEEWNAFRGAVGGISALDVTACPGGCTATPLSYDNSISNQLPGCGCSSIPNAGTCTNGQTWGCSPSKGADCSSAFTLDYATFRCDC